VKKEDNIDPDIFVPVVPKDREELFQQVLNLIKQVEVVPLQALLQKFFDNEAFKAKFVDAPGGKLWHHNYRGGLLEHSLNVTHIALGMKKYYPQLRADLLICAGLLHDVGKIEEFQIEGFINYSDKGRLMGHIVIGSQLVKEMADKIDEFPKSLKTELLHIILSHQGELAKASPVVPMTLEALVLHYADELDSKANAFQRIINQNKDSGQKWTPFVQLMERFIYLSGEGL